MVATVKVLQYIRYNGSTKPIQRAKAHIKYIEADREKHREKPVLFNGKEDKVDRKEFFKRIEEQPRNGVVMHKMVLTMSEDEQKRLKIDMKELTRDTMASFQRKIGRRLDWGAGFHNDPNHPHCHIFFRGRSEDGRQVGIYPIHVKMLKEIAEHEKRLQVERNFSREEARDILKELDKERERTYTKEYSKTQDYQPSSPSSELGFSKNMINTVEQLLKQSHRDMERIQRKAWRQIEQEAEREKSKGRGMSR